MRAAPEINSRADYRRFSTGASAPGNGIIRRMSNAKSTKGAPPTWKKPDGSPVSCVEKIKVLNQNYAELKQMAQDALEDALLMECSEEQIKDALHLMIDDLHNPYD
jgi:hypothetical protein